MRLIDADFLRQRCERQMKDEWNQHAAPSSWAYAYEQFMEDVDNCQTEDPPETKDGKWMVLEQDVGGLYGGVSIVHWFACSECGVDNEYATNYCPNCGAKMDGGVNDAAD